MKEQNDASAGERPLFEAWVINIDMVDAADLPVIRSNPKSIAESRPDDLDTVCQRIMSLLAASHPDTPLKKISAESVLAACKYLGFHFAKSADDHLKRVLTVRERYAPIWKKIVEDLMAEHDLEDSDMRARQADNLSVSFRCFLDMVVPDKVPDNLKEEYFEKIHASVLGAPAEARPLVYDAMRKFFSTKDLVKETGRYRRMYAELSDQAKSVLCEFDFVWADDTNTALKCFPRHVQREDGDTTQAIATKWYEKLEEVVSSRESEQPAAAENESADTEATAVEDDGDDAGPSNQSLEISIPSKKGFKVGESSTAVQQKGSTSIVRVKAAAGPSSKPRQFYDSGGFVIWGDALCLQRMKTINHRFVSQIGPKSSFLITADMPYFVTDARWDKESFVGCAEEELPQRMVDALTVLTANHSRSGMAVVFGSRDQVLAMWDIMEVDRAQKKSPITAIQMLIVLRKRKIIQTLF